MDMKEQSEYNNLLVKQDIELQKIIVDQKHRIFFLERLVENLSQSVVNLTKKE